MKRALISIKELNKGEQKALELFLKHAYALFLVAQTAISFEIWLNMLTEGLQDAHREYQDKNKNS